MVGSADNAEAGAGGAAPGVRDAEAGQAPSLVCLNCGAGVSGHYCQHCGQKAEVHRTLGAFWHDFTHSILHVEGRIWRTLPLLAFRPGQLTRRYIDGQRARFLSPLALFLFSVFLMYAVFSLVGLPLGGKGGPATRVEGRGELERQYRVNGLQLERLSAAMAEARARGAPTAPIERAIAKARQERGAMEVGLKIAGSEVEQEPSVPAISFESGYPELDRIFRQALKNPSLVLYKMQANAYKFSWALVILSIPFLWLAFAGYRNFHLFDHSVFVTYSLAFMGLFMVLLSLVTRAGLEGVSEVLAGAVPPAHMFFQLKGTYGLTVMEAGWRTIYLLFSAVIVLTIFALVLLFFGALG